MGIIGYSGAFLDSPLPKNIVKNDILLIHGELDTVVPTTRMKQAKSKLMLMLVALEVAKHIHFYIKHL